MHFLHSFPFESQDLVETAVVGKKMGSILELKEFYPTDCSKNMFVCLFVCWVICFQVASILAAYLRYTRLRDPNHPRLGNR